MDKKLSKETMDFLKDHPEGHIKDFPDELKKMLFTEAFKNKKSFEEIYNYDGDIKDIKEGVVLIDDISGYVFTITDVIYGSDVTFFDSEEFKSTMMISMEHDKRFRMLKIKEEL